MSSNGTLKRSARLVRSWLGALRGPASPKPPRREVRPEADDEITDSGVSRRDIEALVGMPIGALATYEHALKHRSIFRGLTTDGTESNERLEFLGDAVLGAVVAERLYTTFPERDEGFLTRTRANLVNGKTLADFATKIGLAPLVLLSDNMDTSGGRTNTTILADAFEAIVGAVYVDLGFGPARRFVNTVLDRCVDLREVAREKTNYKSQLLELVQARSLGQPTYDVLSEVGPSHDREFTVAAVVDGKEVGRGTARSKKAAEQEAAQEALDALRETLAKTMGREAG